MAKGEFSTPKNLHCGEIVTIFVVGINWGYSGTCDGYYVAKSKLDASERYANATDVEYTPGVYNISFSYNFRVVTYDLPNE